MKPTALVGIWVALSLAIASVAQADKPSQAADDPAEKSLDQAREDLENRLKEVKEASADADRKAAEEADVNPAPGPLAGFGLAAGLGVISLNDPDISDVSVENGVVRVGTEEKLKNGFWLETHYTFAKGKYVARKNSKGATVYRNRALYHGPFLGVQVTDGTDFLKTVGLGYMMSLKRNRDDPDDKGAFNLGLGVCNTQIQELDGGAVEGQPLPEGQESVRLKKKNVVGGMLVFSFTFL